ncbi:hypothetical protein FKM82_029009 [Ascaphus truei]
MTKHFQVSESFVWLSRDPKTQQFLPGRRPANELITSRFIGSRLPPGGQVQVLHIKSQRMETHSLIATISRVITTSRYSLARRDIAAVRLTKDRSSHMNVCVMFYHPLYI